MNQELQYLREEMNQRISFFYEHSQKTINTILLIWGGTSIILGVEQNYFENINVFFISGTIFFISNLIIYFSAQKDYDNLDCIFKIAAYLAVFYEKRPNKTKTENNISWEIANFETQAMEALNKNNNKKRIYKMNGEYVAIMYVSIAFTLLFTIMLFNNIDLKSFFSLTLFLICIAYIIGSFFLLHKTNTYTSLKYLSDTKKKHFLIFRQYSLDTGYYTEQEMEKRFGNFWAKLGYFE